MVLRVASDRSGYQLSFCMLLFHCKILGFAHRRDIAPFFGITVSIGFCDHPPSEGLRLLKPARPLKQESGYSDRVVAKARVWKYIYTGFIFDFTTRWSLNAKKHV